MPEKMPSGSMTDVIDYLLKQSKNYMNQGEYAFAKAYLMTASALAEDNFLIKIESYKMSKTENKFLDTSKHFVDLFCNSKLWNQNSQQQQNNKKEHKGKNNSVPKQDPEENVLVISFIEEMKKILYSIKECWRHCFSSSKEFDEFFSDQCGSTNVTFYQQLWNKLDIDHQISCIGKFCSLFPTKTELLVDLYLHVIVKYAGQTDSELVIEAAISLVEIMKNVGKNSGQESLQKCLREKYVFHILPVLFGSQSYYQTHGKTETTLEKHFLNGIQYFIEEIGDESKENDMKKRIELEKKLIEIVSLIGRYKKWDIFQIDELNLDRIETNLKTLSKYIHECFCKDNEVLDLSVKLEQSTYRKIAFYSIVLFAILFGRFMSKIKNRVICEKLSSSSDGKQPTGHMNLKKRKLMNYAPSLISGDRELIENVQLLLKFNTSIDFIRHGFDAYIAQINLEKSRPYLHYKICQALHEADYNNALHILKNYDYGDIVNKQFGNLLYWLQYYVQFLTLSIKLNHWEEGAIFLIKIIDLLCSFASDNPGDTVKKTFAQQLTQNLLSVPVETMDESTNDPNESSSSSSSSIIQDINYCSLELANEYHNSRQILFLWPTLENVVGLLIDACILLFASIPFDDSLGHMIVLSQYQWPYFYTSFHKAMQMIRGKAGNLANKNVPPSFIYPLFSTYIFVSDIIEEFKCLVNDYEFHFELEPNKIILKTNAEISNLLLKMLNQQPEIMPTTADFFMTFLMNEVKPFLGKYLNNYNKKNN